MSVQMLDASSTQPESFKLTNVSSSALEHPMIKEAAPNVQIDDHAPPEDDYYQSEAQNLSSLPYAPFVRVIFRKDTLDAVIQARIVRSNRFNPNDLKINKQKIHEPMTIKKIININGQEFAYIDLPVEPEFWDLGRPGFQLRLEIRSGDVGFDTPLGKDNKVVSILAIIVLYNDKSMKQATSSPLTPAASTPYARGSAASPGARLAMDVRRIEGLLFKYVVADLHRVANKTVSQEDPSRDDVLRLGAEERIKNLAQVKPGVLQMVRNRIKEESIKFQEGGTVNPTKLLNIINGFLPKNEQPIPNRDNSFDALFSYVTWDVLHRDKNRILSFAEGYSDVLAFIRDVIAGNKYPSLQEAVHKDAAFIDQIMQEIEANSKRGGVSSAEPSATFGSRLADRQLLKSLMRGSSRKKCCFVFARTNTSRTF
jgi:hypothetical protein